MCYCSSSRATVAAEGTMHDKLCRSSGSGSDVTSGSLLHGSAGMLSYLPIKPQLYAIASAGMSLD